MPYREAPPAPQFSSSANFRSLMSRATFDTPTGLPVEFMIGDAVTDTSISRPSFVSRNVSKWSIRSPRLILARI